VRNDPVSASLDSVGVVIPAYNAASHLAQVVRRVEEIVPRERIIVVEDGSSDATFEVAAGLGINLIRHDRNRGKGAALATAFKKALEMSIPFVITLDADGQHNPLEIPAFLRAQRENGADIVVGNRMTDTATMPWLRRATNWVTSWLLSLRTGQRIPDSQNGYRLHRTELFRHIHLVTTRYDTESEILIKAARLGAIIASVPVETIYGGAKSSINPLVDSYRFLRMVITSFFW
jgi:glycosyltransferase involved in cell wall biosynthesis